MYAVMVVGDREASPPSRWSGLKYSRYILGTHAVQVSTLAVECNKVALEKYYITNIIQAYICKHISGYLLHELGIENAPIRTEY